jgi:hypothetical protein
MQHGLSRAFTAALVLAPGTALAHPGHGLAHDLAHLAGGLDYALALALIVAGGLAVRRLVRAARSSPLRP